MKKLLAFSFAMLSLMLTDLQAMAGQPGEGQESRGHKRSAPDIVPVNEEPSEKKSKSQAELTEEGLRASPELWSKILESLVAPEMDAQAEQQQQAPAQSAQVLGAQKAQVDSGDQGCSRGKIDWASMCKEDIKFFEEAAAKSREAEALARRREAEAAAEKNTWYKLWSWKKK